MLNDADFWLGAFAGLIAGALLFAVFLTFAVYSDYDEELRQRRGEADFIERERRWWE